MRQHYIYFQYGAEKNSLRATYLPRTLNSVIPECYYKIDELAKSEKIKDRIEWASKISAITCPLDKFIDIQLARSVAICILL